MSLNRLAEDRVDEVFIVDPVENVLSEAVQAERRAHNLMDCHFDSGPLPLGHPRGPTGLPLDRKDRLAESENGRTRPPLLLTVWQWP